MDLFLRLIFANASEEGADSMLAKSVNDSKGSGISVVNLNKSLSSSYFD